MFVLLRELRDLRVSSFDLALGDAEIRVAQWFTAVRKGRPYSGRSSERDDLSTVLDTTGSPALYNVAVIPELRAEVQAVGNGRHTCRTAGVIQ